MLSVVGYNEAYLRTLKRYTTLPGAVSASGVTSMLTSVGGPAPLYRARFQGTPSLGHTAPGESWADEGESLRFASQPTLAVDKKPIWLVRRAFSWFLWLIRQFFFFIGCVSVVYPGTQLWLLALVRQFAADAGLFSCS